MYYTLYRKTTQINIVITNKLLPNWLLQKRTFYSCVRAVKTNLREQTGSYLKAIVKIFKLK